MKRSGTLNILKLLKLFKKSSKPFRTSSSQCENTRSAGPVFPQLGLEPNHAGLASQSLFLLEELLQSKTQCHSKTFSSSKNDLKEFRAHSNVFQSSQNKTSSTQIQNNLPNSSQNNMFLRHGSNNIQNTKNPQKTKNPRPSSSMHKLVPFGSKLVPTWFLPGSYGFR